MDEASPTALLLSRASKLLHVIAKQVPGLLDGQMLLAKAHFLRGDYDGALRCCVACSKVDPSFSAAALLHAQILLKMEKYRQANAVMEQVLSQNFASKPATGIEAQARSEALPQTAHLPESAMPIETAVSSLLTCARAALCCSRLLAPDGPRAFDPVYTSLHRAALHAGQG